MMRIAILAAIGVVACVPAYVCRAQAPASAVAMPRVAYYETPAGERPRVVITADPELDDSNSLIRYLLRSTDVRTEALVYASSGVHWRGDGKGTTWSVPGAEYSRFGLNLCPCTSYRWAPGERFIDAAVDAYAEAYPNLRVHDAGYPAPGELRASIYVGNVEFDGEMERDTPGSNRIRALLLDDERSPVYLHAWGGQSTIARALKSIEDEYRDTPRWPEIRARVVAKAVIHPSGDQDGTYARYIRPHWPEIRYRELAGGTPLGYDVQSTASAADARYFGADWMRRNVSSRGLLGSLVRVWGDGRQMVPGDRFDYFGLADQTAPQLKRQGYVVWTPPLPRGEFISEGDTPTFLNLLDNGLRGYREDSFGGWGGHRRVDDPNAPPFDVAAFLSRLEREVMDPDFVAPPRVRLPENRFIPPVMNDLAARLAWATTARYADANHPPRVVLRGREDVAARPGEVLRLRVTTSDPDGDAVSVGWWAWPEAGTYAGRVVLDAPNGPALRLRVPADAKPGDRLQIVAEATDDGAPPLTRYVKVIVTVR